MIRGGTALNIVPRDCTFDFEIRHLPFDDPDAFFAEVQALRRSASCRRCTRSTPDTYIEFDAAVDAAGLRHARRQRRSPRSATRCNGTHERAARCRSAPRRRCSTTRAIPTIICGPGHIAQAHQPNEWVRARAARALRSVHAAARGSHVRDCASHGRGRCAPRPAPPIEVAFPDLARWAAGNTGIPYVWRFDVGARRPARHDPGADARQRSVRRDRARLAARAKACARRAAR